MTTLTDTQVVTASGGLVELGATTFGDLTISGTASDAAASSFSVPVTISFVSDGSPVIAQFSAREQMTGAHGSGSESYVVAFLDGVFQSRITRVQTTGTSAISQTCYGQLRLTPSAGAHTLEFKQFRVNANGSVGTGYATVSKIVQATQWPALTSGVIVCTSVTRPAAPTVGTFIFETDTLNLYVWDGAAWSPVSTQPTGTITSYAGSTSPSGWLLCDGAAVSRTTYAALFTTLSTTYGAGDGTTTFNLPDLRGRMPIGAGNEGAAANNVLRARGEKGGDTRLQSHTHTGSGTTGSTNIDHSHGTGIGQRFGTHVSGQGAAGSGAPVLDNAVDNTGGMNSNANHSHSFSFTSADHNQGIGTGANMPPFLVANYIIKV
jgi:microcystin-dependent protein